MKYTVKVGDTLYGISNQFGVSVTELASINKVDSKTLKVGDILTIPSNSGINPDNMFMYKVKKGDTLYGISKIYNTTVDAIKKLNYLTSNQLYLGQILRIPEVYTKQDEMILPNYINYTVKKGDTLYSIARDNNISVDLLIKDNSLKNNNLVIGQKLKIRINNNGEVLECFGDEYNGINNNSYSDYVVKKGDTLYSIALNNKVSVSELLKANNLNNTSLKIGQIIKIPIVGGNNIYVVKKGDTLYSISKKYGVSVEDIVKKNNLLTNTLNVNQQLII